MRMSRAMPGLRCALQMIPVVKGRSRPMAVTARHLRCGKDAHFDQARCSRPLSERSFRPPPTKHRAYTPENDECGCP